MAFAFCAKMDSNEHLFVVVVVVVVVVAVAAGWWWCNLTLIS